MNKLRPTAASLGITRGDLILAASLLLLAAAAGILTALFRPSPEYVSIRVDGTEVCRLPLDRDCTRAVGDGNTIRISGGSVRMIYADCPDRVCVRSGAISRSGQSIVCAPHKVVIVITGGEKPSTDVNAY